MNTIKNALVVVLLYFLPFTTLAWGLEGHRIVGQIADNYLSKKAKKEIYKILGTESLAMVSNWADFIKSDPAYANLSVWHYINMEGGLSAEKVQDYLKNDTTADVYTKINFLVGELKKKDLSADNKLFCLKMLVHLVGDVHQPMHAGRPEDQGGNKIKVMWFGEARNLHQVWDDQLILLQQLSFTEYSAAINHTTVEERLQWQQQPVSDWVYESYQLAEKIYGDITQPDQKLDYKYNFKYLAILDQQLLKGGVRLAGLLNQIFD